MLRMVFAVLAVLMFSGAALAAQPVPGQPAPQAGEKLVQCVAFKWSVPGDKARVGVEVIVFGKSVLDVELDPENPGASFEFEDGFVKAAGALASSYDEFGGTGALELVNLTYGCDFSGEYSVKDVKITDFKYLARFDY